MADNGRPDDEPDFGREGFGPEADFGPEAEEVDPNDPRFSSKWSKANGKGHGSTGGGAGTTLPVIHTWGEPDTRPLTAWGIRDLMGVSWLAIISGAWGSAKTFLIIEMTFSYVTGERFAQFEVERTGGVLIVIPESPEQARTRLQELTEAKLEPWYRNQGKDPPGRYPIKWVESIGDISTPAGYEQLKLVVNSVQTQFQTEFGVDLVAVFIDTSSAAAPSYKINDPMETSRLYANLQQLRQQANIALVVVDHFGKDAERGTVGGAGKEQKADTILYSIEMDENEFKLHVRKVREARQNYKIAFELVDVELREKDGKGNPIKSKVVRWHNGGEPEEAGKPGRPNKTIGDVLRAINRALNDHGKMRRCNGEEETIPLILNTCTWNEALDAFSEMSIPLDADDEVEDRKKCARKFSDCLKTEIKPGGMFGMYKPKKRGTDGAYLWLTHTRQS